MQINQQIIENGLRKLGVRQGDALEVHSSLSSFGRIEGGAPTLINALINTVGAAGTLIMSAYLVSPAVPLTDADKQQGIKWKVRILNPNSQEKTGMGAVVEEFCRRTDVFIGSGIHRVCAWGHEAQKHSQGYQHLVDSNGWVLLLGVGIDRCSSLHLPEETVGFPPEVLDCYEIPAEIRVNYPSDEWGIGYGETPKDAWLQVEQEAHQRQLIKTGRIGGAECMLFRVRPVIEIYETRLRTDPCALFGVAPYKEGAKDDL